MEKDKYQVIIDFVLKTGNYAYRNSVGRRGIYKFGVKGQSDISGVLRKQNGRRLEIEVKETSKEKLKLHQKVWCALMRFQGALVIEAVTVEDVIKVFEKENLL